MKRISSLLLSSILLISFACSENSSSNESSEELPVEELQTTIDTPTIDNSEAQVLDVNPEIIQQSTTTAPSPVKSGAGLNPPHGEPGHDCAIAVGAPLGSAPSGATQTIQPNIQNPSSVPAQTSPVINPTTPTPVTTMPGGQTPAAGSTGKVNPAHGEPGHDCAKPVGAPL